MSESASGSALLKQTIHETAQRLVEVARNQLANNGMVLRDTELTSVDFTASAPKHVFHYGPVDEARVKGVMYSANVYSTELELFSGGESFEFPGDSPLGGLTSYDAVVLDNEFEPFLVHADHFAFDPKPVREYFDAFRLREAHPPHILDDDACRQIASMLADPALEQCIDLEFFFADLM